jgi:hypothetical protein
MSSNKRKSPPNKFEENAAGSVVKIKEEVLTYEDRLQDPGALQLPHPHPMHQSKRKSAGGAGEGLPGPGPMETSGDELSDLGSYISGCSSDPEETDGLPAGKTNGRCGGRRSTNCRESTSGESSSAKSPTLSSLPNHNDARHSRKSMDDVLRKLSSRFSSTSENTTGGSFPGAFSLDSR